ncbi:MAG: sigma-70 family RNA polymerase sigma factor [Planctomycetota bacterium]|nr:sigma-70 family RNA polymerase sigma factor [Planctomycetota bacterium]
MTQSEHKRHGNGPTSDLELARRVVEGHPDAQRVFAERMRCVPRMIACRNRRLGRPLRPEELEDLTQETLLRIWRKLGAFEGRATLETWVHRFCYLEFSNHLRKHGRQMPQASFEEEDAVAAPADPDESAQVAHYLRHLPERESQVLHLRFAESLEFPEIATELGVSVSTVKTHCYRGLTKLREMLAPAEEERR